MHITAIIVSVDFDDFLDLTLAVNKPHLDSIYVVTSQDDRATQAVCRQHDVGCLPIRRTTPFLKGIYINHALRTAPRHDWFLILDADTALPPHFRSNVTSKKLDRGLLWGVHQRYCYSYEEWVDYSRNRTPYNWHRRSIVTMGCFQLFHTSQFETMPDLAYEPFTVDVESGKGSDWFFSRRFHRRGNIVGVEVVHLSAGPTTITGVVVSAQGSFRTIRSF